MLIKLSSYALDNSWNEIKYGMQVCPINGAASVGTVVDISKEPHEDSWKEDLPANVTVLWGTGKKRGKKMVHPPENLVDFTKYLAAVQKEYDALVRLKTEAESVGM